MCCRSPHFERALQRIRNTRELEADEKDKDHTGKNSKHIMLAYWVNLCDTILYLYGHCAATAHLRLRPAPHARIPPKSLQQVFRGGREFV